jgi:hypothetical protein
MGYDLQSVARHIPYQGSQCRATQAGVSEIPFNSGKSVEDFLLRLNTMASQLYVLGEEVTHKEVIKCLLHSITERLE